MSFIKRLLGSNKPEDGPFDDELDYIDAHSPREELSAYERALEFNAPPRRVVRIDADGKQIFNGYTIKDDTHRIRRRRSDRWRPLDDEPEPTPVEEQHDLYDEDPYSPADDDVSVALYDEPAPLPAAPSSPILPFALPEESADYDPAPRAASTPIIVSRDCPLQRLELGTRTFNALMRGGIRTVGALLDIPIANLHHYKHIGAAAIAEIERVIAEINDPDGTIMLVHSVANGDIPAGRASQMAGTEGGYIPLDPALDAPVGELGLSVRATNSLLNAGVRTAKQLFQLDRKRLLKMRNMGTKSADEVLTKIAELRALQRKRER